MSLCRRACQQRAVELPWLRGIRSRQTSASGRQPVPCMHDQRETPTPARRQKILHAGKFKTVGSRLRFSRSTDLFFPLIDE